MRRLTLAFAFIVAGCAAGPHYWTKMNTAYRIRVGLAGAIYMVFLASTLIVFFGESHRMACIKTAAPESRACS
jgi:hypothetical protein